MDVEYVSTRHILTWSIVHQPTGTLLYVSHAGMFNYRVHLNDPDDAEIWVDDLFTHVEYVNLASLGIVEALQ